MSNEGQKSNASESETGKENQSPAPPDPNPEAIASGTTPTKAPEPPKQPNLGEFTAGRDERCLWHDPLSDDNRMQDGAVLLGDVIRDYVVKYNILFDKAHFDEGKLKGGSYTMTPDENGAWTFKPDEKKVVKFDPEKDHIGKYYLVPPNSLIYIKLKQTLRVPFYLIGRHNLKIRYVYKGLLLGTGPQVDPGFEGNLFIPLHNFTTSEVKIYVDGPQNSFVSIDFVRTTHFLTNGEVPPDIMTVGELRRHLISSKSPKVLIEEDKVKRRRTLEDYLEGATPLSQLAQFEFDFRKLEKSVRRTLLGFQALRFIEVIAVAGIVISALSFFNSDVASVKSEADQFKGAITNLGEFRDRLNSLDSRQTIEAKSQKALMDSINTNVAQSQKSLIDSINTNVTQIQKEINQLTSQINAVGSNSVNAGRTHGP